MKKLFSTLINIKQNVARAIASKNLYLKAEKKPLRLYINSICTQFFKNIQPSRLTIVRTSGRTEQRISLFKKKLDNSTNLMQLSYSAFSVFFLLCIVCLTYTEAPFQPYWPREPYQSQTFLFTRPVGENVVAKKALWHSIIYDHSGSCGAGLQIMPMYQQASGTHKNRYYWLLDCHTELLFAGDAVVNDKADRDVRAEWFSLPADFKGQMSFHPVQRQAGIYIEYHQNFAQFFDNQWLQDCWFSVELPVVYVENDMQLTQWNIHNPGHSSGEFADIKESFCNPAWQYLKVCGKKHTVQAAFLNAVFGKSYSHSNRQYNFYAGLTVPVSAENDPRSMFSPIAGYNGHWGMLMGIDIQLPLAGKESCCPVCFFAELDAVFLFHNTQQRTFDLICKPWSRYLQYVKRDSPSDAFIPGVNLLTRKVRVHPYTLVDIACGVRVILDRLEYEIGYGIWGHGDEKIELRCGATCPEDNEYGIAGHAPTGYHQAVTASRSTIKNQAPYDRDEQGSPVFVPITDSQLDLLSGASRSALNHKVFASIGSLHHGDVSYLYGAGFYIEIPQWRTSLQSWGIWAKYGVTF